LGGCIACSAPESTEREHQNFENKTHVEDLASKAGTTDKLQNGETGMSELTQAITQREARAPDVAVRMGNGAIAELSQLMQSDDSTTRMMTVRALGAMDLSISYQLLFKALDDDDSNVIHAALHEIEKKQASLSTDIQLSLLDKLEEPNARNRVILMLGNRLKVGEIAPLDKFCSTEQPQVVALHCMTALAKIGVELRRKQFAAYLLSITDDTKAFTQMFDLIEYIDQPWIVPSLRLLLSNKQDVLFLGDSATQMGFPSFLRVCDKAVHLIAKLIDVNLSFNSVLAANYTDEQLAEVNAATSNFTY